mgnify:CR=1 FL=1|tara:strand:+ start:282 stop:428 length:147 start_codon:yes stop_codon:yes gene_type:complete
MPTYLRRFYLTETQVAIKAEQDAHKKANKKGPSINRPGVSSRLPGGKR